MDLKKIIKNDIQKRQMTIIEYAELMDIKPRKLYRLIDGTTKPSVHLLLLTLLATDSIFDMKKNLLTELIKEENQ